MVVLTKIAAPGIILIHLALFLLFSFNISSRIYTTCQALATLHSYAPQQAFSLIGSHAEDGRGPQPGAELSLDPIYPLISALLLGLGILYSSERSFARHRLWCRAALTPSGVMLSGFPRRHQMVAGPADLFAMPEFLLSRFERLVFVISIGWLIQAFAAWRSIPCHAGH